MGGREIVATGTWLYDGTAPMPVAVVRLDHDFWYELGAADGDPEHGASPQLDAGGHAYYVSFRPPSADDRFWPDSIGHRTVAEAMATAQAKVPTPIDWASPTT